MNLTTKLNDSRWKSVKVVVKLLHARQSEYPTTVSTAVISNTLGLNNHYGLINFFTLPNKLLGWSFR